MHKGNEDRAEGGGADALPDASGGATKTLVEHLREFPAFFSLDGGHWYRASDKEPIAQQAADTIERLQTVLEYYADADFLYDGGHLARELLAQLSPLSVAPATTPEPQAK